MPAWCIILLLSYSGPMDLVGRVECDGMLWIVDGAGADHYWPDPRPLGPMRFVIYQPSGAQLMSVTIGQPITNTISLDLSEFAGVPYQISWYRVGSAPDFDGDSDVDQADFGKIQACLSGAGVWPTSECVTCDMDRDGDVDALDVAAFRKVMLGAQ